jgi:hypothetical protein
MIQTNPLDLYVLTCILIPFKPNNMCANLARIDVSIWS